MCLLLEGEIFYGADTVVRCKLHTILTTVYNIVILSCVLSIVFDDIENIEMCAHQ